MIVDGQRWYVVQSQPNAEAKAVLHLNRQGFVTYLPRYLKRRRHARRVETVAGITVSRYLFVGIDLNAQRWRSIFSTVGVSRLVCQGELPMPISAASSMRSRRARTTAGSFASTNGRVSSGRQDLRARWRLRRLSWAL